jgi:hypothetical protein
MMIMCLDNEVASSVLNRIHNHIEFIQRITICVYGNRFKENLVRISLCTLRNSITSNSTAVVD